MSLAASPDPERHILILFRTTSTYDVNAQPLLLHYYTSTRLLLIEMCSHFSPMGRYCHTFLYAHGKEENYETF